ncbi:MAG: SCO family protein [Candidatus Thiodiazotropha sp.]
MQDHSLHKHDQHAHHRAMLENKSYQVKHASYHLPDVKLISHRGEPLQLADILDSDKPVMLNFIFTTCTTICPVLSASFHQVQKILGDEVGSLSMVSITIDPDYDTPEQLMEYSKRFKAGDQWNFYTGSYNDIVSVEKAFDIFRGSKMNHEPITLIRGQGGKHWTRIDGLASAEDIVKEYKKVVSAAN